MGRAITGTWKPELAGVLDIILGALLFFASLLGLCVGILCAGDVGGEFGAGSPLEAALWILIPLAGIVASLLAIIGGIYALRKKGWGWAVIGSASLTIAGIPSLILILLSKRTVLKVQKILIYFTRLNY